MSDWQKITPTSPTEEECKRGVLIHWLDQYEQDQADLVISRYDANQRKAGWWIPFTPPPRPDPAKEAFEAALKTEAKHYAQDIGAFTRGWHAALAWKEGSK